MISAKPQRFVRTPFTLLAYFMLAYYAFLQAILGPLMPFLRDELRLSYSEAGLHFSAFALGMVISGLISDRVTRRFGRRAVFWGGGIGMAGAALVLIAARTPAVTVFASFLEGFLGTMLLVNIQAGLADAHGPFRAFALTESNITASLAASAAPLLIGLFQSAGPGWRLAVIVGVAAYVLAAARAWRVPVATMEESVPGIHTVPETKLPPLFWLYSSVVFLGVAAEWSIGFWGASFLEAATPMTKAAASTAMTAFFGALVLGRVVGSRLVRTISPQILVLLALAITVSGFPLFWLGGSAGVRVAGLAIVGVGIANVFPLILSLALGIAPALTGRASARITLASGTAILVAPQLLGIIADRAGIAAAYGIVAMFLVAAAVVMSGVVKQSGRGD